MMIRLEDIGFNEKLERYRIEQRLTDFETGRVIAEHKERYIVSTENAELEAEISGNLRFTAESREDFPAVGDWVSLTVYDSDFAIIHKVFPRSSVIKRQAVGQHGEVQIIAANIDFGFVVQAVDRDFNLNRIERYLTICYSSLVSPVIILTKTDLITAAQLAVIEESIYRRIKNVPVVAISNETEAGYHKIKSLIERGKTYCMLGSSGVGKSTLSNNLSGSYHMKTDTISQKTNKGRHITSHRELIIMENGGLLIDNPGMREVGIADSARGLETTFNDILLLAQQCRFADCTHTNEKACAVLDALKNGEIDIHSYNNYLKMEREKAHFEATVEEKRKKDKDLGKLINNYKKIAGKNFMK